MEREEAASVEIPVAFHGCRAENLQVSLKDTAAKEAI